MQQLCIRSQSLTPHKISRALSPSVIGHKPILISQISPRTIRFATDPLFAQKSKIRRPNLSYTGGLMKKPIGLIFSAIILSLAALCFLLVDVCLVFASILWTGQSSTHPQLPHFFVYIIAAVGVFYLGLAIWAAFTVFGILRLRPWGRYSILVIGGGLAFTSLMSFFSFAATRSTFPQQPGIDPRIAQFVFIAILVFNGLVMAIGIWWLIYFTRRPIRSLFQTPAFTPSYYAPPSSSIATEAHAAASAPDSPAAPPYTQPAISYLPAKHSNGFFSSPEHAPTVIKIFGWFFLVGAVFCLPMVFLPIPAFILGFIISIKASHVLFFAILVMGACVGYGLIKLRNSARVAAIALISFGLVNSAISLLPWYQNQFRQYIAQFMTHIMAIIPPIPGQPAPVYSYPAATIVFNSLVGVAINIYVLWELHRHRTAFTSPPPIPQQS